MQSGQNPVDGGIIKNAYHIRSLSVGDMVSYTGRPQTRQMDLRSVSLTRKYTYGKEREDFYMRKVLSMVMACAMTAAVVAGCSSPAKENAPESVTAAESVSTETSQEEKTDESQESYGAEDGQNESAAETEAGERVDLSGNTPILRIGSLKGPTTMGMVSLIDKAAKGEAKGSYEFTMVTAADELVGKMVSGDLDIALVPANMASILYQKTGQGIEVLNINTLGVLYVVAGDDSLKTIPDLKGRTVYMTGKGTTPDHVFQYLLSANSLGQEDVTVEYKSEAAEVAAILKEQPDAIGLLPQPFVTAAMAQNENLKMVMDLTKEWDSLPIEEGGRLVTGVTVCRKEVLEDAAMRESVKAFMEEHKESTEFVNNNVELAGNLVAEAGIIEKAPVAQKAIPYCGIVCIDGEEMKTMLSGYLNVLFEQDASSVGGKLPDDGFYYIP